MKVDHTTGVYTTGTRQVTPTNREQAAAAAGAGRQTPSTDGLLSDAMKLFETQFPGVKIRIADLEDKQALSEYVKNQNGSFQVVLSKDAVRRMLSDPEFFKRCQDIIGETRKQLYERSVSLGATGHQVLGSGMYIDEDGNVAQWTVSRRKEQTDNQNYHPWLPTTSKRSDGSVSRFQDKDGREYMIKTRLSYRPAKDLSRLARARNQQMVKSTISSIRGSIYQLRTGGGDKKASKQLVNQAEQVLLKAQLKSRQLKKEELLEIAGKRAEEQSEFKKAMYLKRMLEEKKVKRMVREYTQIRDYYPSPEELRRAEERAEQLAESIAGPTATVENSGMQSYAPGTAPSSAPVSAPSGEGVFIDIRL